MSLAAGAMIMLVCAKSDAADGTAIERYGHGAQYAYFFGWNGTFLKIDVDRLTVAARGRLPRPPRPANRVPRDEAASLWRASHWRADPVADTVFASFPAGVDETAPAVVFALGVPDFAVAGQWGPFDCEVAPRVLPSADGRQLLIARCDRAGASAGNDRIDIVDLATGRLQRTIVNATFNERAVMAPDGSIYESGGETTRLVLGTGDTANRSPVDPRSFLGAAQRAGWRRAHAGADDTAAQILLGDIANGRALLIVRDPIDGARAVTVIDLTAKQDLSPLIDVPPTGLLYLASDGGRIVWAETQAVPQGNGPAAGGPTWTGRFRSYDVRTGAEEPPVAAARLADGSHVHKLLCLADDARTLFFASRVDHRWQLGAVRLGDAGSYVPIRTDFAADASTECVKARR